VLDDLERALNSLPQDSNKASWAEGFKLIARKLQSTLEAMGLAEVEATGKPFDPHIHEAIAQGEGEEGIVTQQIQKGYTFCDRLIRPCRVVVGTGKKEEKKEKSN